MGCWLAVPVQPNYNNKAHAIPSRQPAPSQPSPAHHNERLAQQKAHKALLTVLAQLLKEEGIEEVAALADVLRQLRLHPPVSKRGKGRGHYSTQCFSLCTVGKWKVVMTEPFPSLAGSKQQTGAKELHSFGNEENVVISCNKAHLM